MTVEVTANTNDLKVFPSSEIEEITQNVRMIITTPKGTVPMDRFFGIDSALIDMPLAAARAKMTASIVSAVKTFEPRAAVTNVFYEGNEMDGLLNIRVQFKVVERNLRGGVF